MADLTRSRLRERLLYDPQSGVWIWRTAKSRKFIGMKAGSVNSRGYVQIQIDGSFYVAHRLAFLYMTGKWPLNEVDHINGDRLDNRYCNLRQATRAENGRNAALQKRNGVGVKGVDWYIPTRKWRVRIVVDRKEISLGYYKNLEDAAKAREEGEKRHFGKFRRRAV